MASGDATGPPVEVDAATLVAVFRQCRFCLVPTRSPCKLSGQAPTLLSSNSFRFLCHVQFLPQNTEVPSLVKHRLPSYVIYNLSSFCHISDNGRGGWVFTPYGLHSSPTIPIALRFARAIINCMRIARP